MTTVLDGQPLVTGHGAGNALILEEPLSLWGGLDPQTGEVIDRRHPNAGQNVAGRVLMMSGSRGSSSASSILLEAVRAGTAPAAIILQERDGILSLGAAVAQEMYGTAPPVVVLSQSNYGKIVAGSHIEVLAEVDRAQCTILSLL